MHIYTSHFHGNFTLAASFGLVLAAPSPECCLSSPERSLLWDRLEPFSSLRSFLSPFSPWDLEMDVQSSKYISNGNRGDVATFEMMFGYAVNVYMLHVWMRNIDLNTNDVVHIMLSAHSAIHPSDRQEPCSQTLLSAFITYGTETGRALVLCSTVHVTLWSSEQQMSQVTNSCAQSSNQEWLWMVLCHQVMCVDCCTNSIPTAYSHWKIAQALSHSLNVN